MLDCRRAAGRGLILFGVSILLSSIVVACGSPTPSTPVAVTANPSAGASLAVETQPPSSFAASTPSAADEQQAADLIAHANSSDPSSLDAIEGQLLYTAAGGEAARAALDTGVSGDQLWAALWVYGTTGADPAPVVRYMSDSDPTISALASADDAEMGDVSGFDQLSQLLNDQEAMANAEPPESISEFVVNALASDIVAQSAPSDGGDASQWSDWLSTNRAQLTFDAQTGEWTGP